MKIEDIRSGCKYECKVGQKVAPIHVRDTLPAGIVCVNLDTNRELYIKAEDIPKRVRAKIENMDQWRLNNGD